MGAKKNSAPLERICDVLLPNIQTSGAENKLTELEKHDRMLDVKLFAISHPHAEKTGLVKERRAEQERPLLTDHFSSSCVVAPKNPTQAQNGSVLMRTRT